MRRRYGLLAGCCAVALLTALADGARAEYRPVTENTVVDLTGTVSMSHKQWWPGGERHHQPIIVPYIKHGPGPLRRRPADRGREHRRPVRLPAAHDAAPGQRTAERRLLGNMTCDKVPAWQFMGEVVKVDGRRILDQAPNGVSPIFTVDMIKQTEQEIGRSLGAGDVVLYWSRYVDQYDKPGEAGKRLHIDPLAGKAPAFPAPNFDAQDYLGSKGVRTVALDSPSIGAFGAAGLRDARNRQPVPDSQSDRKPPRPVQARRDRHRGADQLRQSPERCAVHRPAGQARALADSRDARGGDHRPGTQPGADRRGQGTQGGRPDRASTRWTRPLLGPALGSATTPSPT